MEIRSYTRFADRNKLQKLTQEERAEIGKITGALFAVHIDVAENGKHGLPDDQVGALAGDAYEVIGNLLNRLGG